LDIYEIDRTALKIGHLSTIVIDEVDDLIGIPSRVTRKAEKEWKNFKRHPPPSFTLLTKIFASTKPDVVNDQNLSSQPLQSNILEHHESMQKSIQVIMSSATVHSNLKDYLVKETKWLNSDFVFISGHEKCGDSIGNKNSGGDTKHYALVITRDGHVKNIDDVHAVSTTKLQVTDGQAEGAAEVLWNAEEEPGEPSLSHGSLQQGWLFLIQNFQTHSHQLL
jgi:hypothetical protein